VDAGGFKAVSDDTTTPALYLEATQAAYASTLLDVVASEAGYSQSYNLLQAREGTNLLLGLRGDGLLTVNGDILMGDDITQDTVTINAVIQGR